MPKPYAICLLLVGLSGFSLSDHPLSLWLALTSLTILFLMAARLIRFPRETMTLAPTEDGRFRLQPRLSRGERWRNFCWPIVIAGLIAGALLMWPTAPNPSATTQPADRMIAEREAIALIAIAALMALPAYTIWSLSTWREPEPKLTISTDTPRLDEPFNLCVDFDHPLKPTGPCTVRLRSFEHVLLHFGRYVQTDVRPKSDVSMTLDLHAQPHAIPLSTADGHLPTGRIGVTSYPYYHWEIHLTVGR